MQRYKPSEIDSNGDIQTVKNGWVECSLTLARGATKKYTKVIGWSKSRFGNRPQKVAVVPEKWLAEKLDKQKRSPKERIKLLPAELHNKCYIYFYSRCKTCKGYGLVHKYNHIEDEHFRRKCPMCGGRGNSDSRKLFASMVTLAEKSIASGMTVAQIESLLVDKYPRCTKPEDTWDGTITSTWLKNGYVTEQEAQDIREKCRKRHEETEYDQLLFDGYSKSEATQAIGDTDY